MESKESGIMEIAERIRALRDITDISVEDIAKHCNISEKEYMEYELGEKDFSVTFLMNCAKVFGVELVEIMTGESPHLKRYSIVRAKKGLSVSRRKSFKYEHLAHSFSNKNAEPFYVIAPYDESEQDKPIQLSSHEGQEMDYVLEGSLKISLGGNIEYLNEGDTIYYNSSMPHGMIATGGKDCKFIAILVKGE